MDKNKAEEQLREIANKAGTSIKQIYSLVTQAYIDDTHYQEKVNQLRNVEVQYKQLRLLNIQTDNGLIENELLAYKLRRKQWWMKLFSKSPKPIKK